MFTNKFMPSFFPDNSTHPFLISKLTVDSGQTGTFPDLIDRPYYFCIIRLIFVQSLCINQQCFRITIQAEIRP